MRIGRPPRSSGGERVVAERTSVTDVHAHNRWLSREVWSDHTCAATVVAMRVKETSSTLDDGTGRLTRRAWGGLLVLW
jgi:hypothetical protein